MGGRSVRDTVTYLAATLDAVDLSADAGARTLRLGSNQSNTFSGEASDDLVTADPFTFLRPHDG